ncbi:MAG: choice-of-anchor D domain-containing protein [Desulfobacter postgatei]|uniref:beta strand repeat-containing protein n=1 Tax=Desulfobacter postgatei TaxID=2293 RepID=UPI0023F27F84|nr:choice-of-anchor D domain-containing protein [Desulfobacter postgatei]MDD4274926.1 choice-of-anchor D domain-containing protein [Desulfobacter postgatei]
MADTFSEGLNATIGSATGNAMAGGSFNLLAAGVSDSSSLVVGIDTSTAGAKSGTAQIELVSDGAGTSDLGQTSIGSQTVNVSGNVYRYASASDHTPEPVVLTNVHVGDTSEQTLIITNTAVADTFSEGLNASIGSATGNATASGSFNLLAAGASDSSSLVVGIDTSTAGAKSGTAQIDLVSDGIGTSELGQTAIGSQTVNVSGNVYRYASAGDHTPEPVVLTNVHVGDTSEQTLIITNTAVADTFSEGLNATIGSATGNTTAGGSFNLLAAGASDSSSLVVGIDTSTAGAKSGTAQIELVSDGAGTSDLGQTSIGSQTVNVSGNVYRLADVNTLNSVNFGSVHVGDSVGQALDITNTAVADGFSESLNAAFAGVSDARILTSGSITQLAAGASDYSSMLIGLDTSAVGTITGIATVDFQSDGTGTSELGITDLSSQDVGVSGSIIEATVYRLANPVINNAQPLAFGNFREGDSVNAQSLSITNDVPDDDYSEALNAAVNGTTGGVTVAGSFNLLGPTQTDNSSISVAIDTSSAGDKSGTATIDFESDGTGSSGLGITHLDSQDVAVTAAVYRLAQGLAAPDPIIINARVGDLGEQTVTITNTALADGYSESLNASTGVTTGDVTAIGSVNLLAAQNTDNSSLVFGINTSTAGVKNGTATVDFESDGTGTSGFAAIDVGSQVVGVSGNVYAPAQASASATNVDFSIVHVGDVLSDMAVTVTNTALVTALNDVLCGSISTSSSPFNASGDLGSGLTAGASADLFVGLDTATAGIYTGSATISTVSHNEDMADWRLADISVDLMAQINNYANPVFSLLSGYGSLSGSGFDYWLDLGTVLQGTGTLETNLALFNDVSGPADLLNGSFDLTGSDFLMTGFDLFSDMNAGEGLLDLLISLDTVTLGAYTGEITLNAIAHNASGFEQIFDPITVYISANVVDNTAAPIPEPATIILFAMGLMLMLKFNIHQGRKK